MSHLRSSFNKAHHSLKRFYDDCRTLRYLTSLITIPTLPQDAPDFLAKGPPTRQPKVASLEKEQQDDEDERFREEQERVFGFLRDLKYIFLTPEFRSTSNCFLNKPNKSSVKENWSKSAVVNLSSSDREWSNRGQINKDSKWNSLVCRNWRDRELKMNECDS